MSDKISRTITKLNQDYVVDDEIDLRELMAVIWAGKWTILVLTFLFVLLAVIYALNQPNVYKSEVLLAPVEQEQSLGALQGQLGGLASLAGINLGGGSNSQIQLAIAILKSRHFTSEFIQKHNILPDLMAADFWDITDNTMVYDSDMYSVAEDIWIRDVSLPFMSKPSMQEAYEVFSDMLAVDTDSETGMITFTIEHMSPFIAQQWINWLVEDINKVMKIRDVAEAEESMAFLTTQLEKTKITDIREVLYKLVEEQAKTIMFANVHDEYVFKTIDPALVSEEKSGPKRILICVLGFMFGGFLGLIVIIIKHFRIKTT
jgi:uncharacterized protein involved in exopolysaccharide biosynthesis